MIHGELKADAETLPLTVASMALTNADKALTRPVDAIAIENADGSRTLIGPTETSGVTPWVGDTTPPPAPKGLTAECVAGTILATWDGTLEDTTPADFSHITVWTRKDGATDWAKAGDLTAAGSLAVTGYAEGDIVDIRATAWDDAHAEDGTPSPNQSEPGETLTVIVEPPVSQQELADRATTILAAAKQDAAAQVKTVDDGLTAANKRISANTDAITAEKKTREKTDATVKQIRTDVDANTSAATSLKKQQADLSTQLDAQGTRISANEQGVSANAKQITAAQSSIDSVSKTVTANKSAQDAINSQQAETNKTITANATEIAAAKKRISANESAIGTLNGTTIPGINSTLSQAQKDIKSNKDAIAAANADIATANSTLSQAQKDIAANKSAIASANEDIASANSTLSQAQKDIAANKTAIASANSTISQTNSTLAQARKDIKANASAIADANKRIASNQTAIANLNGTTIPGIDSTLAQAQKQISANKTAISDANRQIGANTSALSTANANIAKAQQTADGAVSKALAAQSTADGKNRVYRQPGEPAHTGLNTGDLWYRTHWYTHWQGGADNSPSVMEIVDDQADEVLTWDGSAWNDFELVANDIIAAGTIAGDKLAANTITADRLGAGSVTAAKLAANSVTATSIAAGAVTAGKLAANSVNAGNITANAVTADKLAANSVTAGKVAANAIGASNITANAVTSDKLAANSVTAGKVAAKSIGADSIVSGAVTTDKLAAGAVTAAKIAAGAVTADAVAANAVNAASIVSGAVTADKLAANAVTAGKVAADAITGGNIKSGSVNADRLTASSITSAQLAANAVTAGKIAANAVTTATIAAGAVNADKLAANAVTAGKIAAGAVTADKLAANSVTAGKVAANAIGAGNIVSGTVTADKLAANSVNADKLAANSVTGAKISADALYGKTIQGGVFRTSNGRLLLNDSGIIAKSDDATAKASTDYYTYWQGDPDNSPSVMVVRDTLTDNGTFALDTGTGAIALRGSITSGSDISGTTITGSVFRTTNGRMTLNDSGLKLTDKNGATTVTLDAGTGDATFKGTVSGSKVTGGTISGATITGSSFASPDGRTKLNSSGFYVGDRLAYNASTGALSLSGSITSSTITGASITGGIITGAEFRNSDQSIKLNAGGLKLGDKLAYDNASGTLSLKGSIQSGSTIGAVTITGATIQTSATASRGLKMTSGGLIAYDANGKAKFTLTTDGTIKTDGMVVANGSLTGPSVTGASITGGTITGATIQTSSTASRGVKITGSGIQSWDGNGVQTVKLTGSENVIAGVLKTAASGSRLEIRNTTSRIPSKIPNGQDGSYTSASLTCYTTINGSDTQTWSLTGGGYIESQRSAFIREVSLATSDTACIKLGEYPDGAHAYITARHIEMNGVEFTPTVTTDAASIMTLSDRTWSYRTGGESTPRCWMTRFGRSVFVHMEVDRTAKPQSGYVIGKLLAPPAHGVDLTGRCGATIQPLFIGTDGSVELTADANDTWIIFDAHYLTN